MPKRRPLHRARPGRRITLFRLGLAALPVLLVGGVAIAATQPAKHTGQDVQAAAQAATSVQKRQSRPAEPGPAQQTDQQPGQAADAADAGQQAQPGQADQAGQAGHGRHAADARPGGEFRNQGNKDNQPPADAPNPNCTLTVPADPLSAQGLAQPYVLSATDGDAGPCNEANADQSAFVEATILDPATGALSVYKPLVVDRGTQPAVPPVVPALPPNAVVGIWFGFNGDTLTIRGNSIAQANCVNGLGASLFGQFAHCNAPAFFAAAHAAIDKGQLKVPDVGTGKDGLPCPTVHDFGVVDQDQSDNVTTTYVASADGRTAQATAAAIAQVPGAQILANGSDNRLLDAFVDPALGCAPFTAPDLTDGGRPTTSLALNELQAGAKQGPPVALAPLNDPMTQVDGEPSVAKTNLYRAGVGQPPIDPAVETPQEYCQNLATLGRQRLKVDRALFAAAPSPDPAAQPNLLLFLKDRLKASLQELKCGNK